MKSAKTRLGFTGLVVCGAAVLVWGAADLYAWATTGARGACCLWGSRKRFEAGGKHLYQRPGKAPCGGSRRRSGPVGAEGKPAQGPKVRNAVGFPPLFLLPVLTNPRQSCIILYAVKKTALQS